MYFISAEGLEKINAAAQHVAHFQRAVREAQEALDRAKENLRKAESESARCLQDLNARLDGNGVVLLDGAIRLVP